MPKSYGNVVRGVTGDGSLLSRPGAEGGDIGQLVVDGGRVLVLH